MGSLFKTPKLPDPPPLPEYQSAVDVVADDAVKEKSRRFTGRGRASTLLTSPLGVSGEAQGLKKTLLGE